MNNSRPAVIVLQRRGASLRRGRLAPPLTSLYGTRARCPSQENQTLQVCVLISHRPKRTKHNGPRLVNLSEDIVGAPPSIDCVCLCDCKIIRLSLDHKCISARSNGDNGIV